MGSIADDDNEEPGECKVNAQNAKDYLPLVQALIEGKVIQVEVDGKWVDMKGEIHFSGIRSDYHIKPEPREVFIPRWPDGFEGASYDSEEEARKTVSVDTKCKIIRYREVIE